jgi:hypothetical protein
MIRYQPQILKPYLDRKSMKNLMAKAATTNAKTFPTTNAVIFSELDTIIW